MSPSVILKQSAADGVILSLTASGSVKASGDQHQVDKWLPVIREHKISIIAVLSEAANDLQSVASFRWLIHFSDREPVEKTFSPMATHAEVLAHWSGAVAAEQMPEASRRFATNTEAVTLRQLVAAIYHDDSDDDRNEALQAAMADPDNALACYTAIASERGLILADDDDRRTCRQCANLTYSGACSVATPGGEVSAQRGYRPSLDLLQRCEVFNERNS